MKSRILRILISAILFSIVSGIFVSILGLVLGWNTFTQFSDGFFYAGAILISVGLISVLGAFGQRTVAGLRYSQSAVHLDAIERYRIWASDIMQGYNLLAFLGITGLLLIGLSGLALLIGRLF